MKSKTAFQIVIVTIGIVLLLYGLVSGLSEQDFSMASLPAGAAILGVVLILIAVMMSRPPITEPEA